MHILRMLKGKKRIQKNLPTKKPKMATKVKRRAAASNTCPDHPSYGALRKPRTGCTTCEALYNAARAAKPTKAEKPTKVQPPPPSPAKAVSSPAAAARSKEPAKSAKPAAAPAAVPAIGCPNHPRYNGRVPSAGPRSRVGGGFVLCHTVEKTYETLVPILKIQPTMYLEFYVSQFLIACRYVA